MVLFFALRAYAACTGAPPLAAERRPARLLCGRKENPKGGTQMHQVVVEWIGAFGYWGVFALIAVENIFPPIPSEVILTFAGFCTATTALRAPGVVAAATLGSLAGALVLYGVGRLLQPRRLDALLAGPVGRALHMEKQDVEKAAAWFAQKGAASVFYCRCVPIVRSLISIPAGMAGMRLVPFFLYTAAGSTVWNPSGGPWRGCGAKLAARGRGHCICLCRAEMGAGPYGRCPAGGGVCAAPCS